MTCEDPERTLPVATVGLGANLGDREAAISGAIARIVDRKENRLLAESSLYETEPFGKTDQDRFLNSVIRVETRLSLRAFFRLLQEIESSWGRRERRERWGPRRLDLDLLLFGNRAFSDPVLTVPHPGIALRRFVLEPLCEVAPDLMHPTLGMSMRELRDALIDRCSVDRLDRFAFGKNPTDPADR
jgi:2-amino-4-hydroxy-6-hydroxymethyldihydropteridine diphosphokinase